MTIEQIIALLMGKFTGVRKDGLKALARMIAIQAATEDDAKAIIEKLTDAQVGQFVKDFRADVDKEVSESNKTFEANLKKKFKFVEITEPGGKEDEKNDDVKTLVANAVAEAIKPFADSLKTFQSDKLTETRLSQLNAKLAECKDENFKSQTLKDFKRMTFADDAAFEEYLNEKSTDIATANQNVADEHMRSTGAPFVNDKNEQGVSKAVADFVATQKPENNQFAGKEV
jgi:hypothetical protein